MARKRAEQTPLLVLVKTHRGKPVIVKLGTDQKALAKELQKAAGAFEYDGEEGRLYVGKSEEGDTWTLHTVAV